MNASEIGYFDKMTVEQLEELIDRLGTVLAVKQRATAQRTRTRMEGPGISSMSCQWRAAARPTPRT